MPPKVRQPRDKVRDKLRDIAGDETLTRPERARRVARQRARAVSQDWTERHADAGNVAVAGVRFGHVEEIEGGVEIWHGAKVGAPDYRIFNPPTLVTDPTGDVWSETHEKRYREDPLAAVAELIVSVRRTNLRKSRRT